MTRGLRRLIVVSVLMALATIRDLGVEPLKP